jgi:hypothetical protein
MESEIRRDLAEVVSNPSRSGMAARVAWRVGLTV